MTLQRVALPTLLLFLAPIASSWYIEGRACGQEDAGAPAWAPVTKEGIPRNMSPDVRALVEKTFLHDPLQRRNAARELGRLGERAVPAIPYLAKIGGHITSFPTK